MSPTAKLLFYITSLLLSSEGWLGAAVRVCTRSRGGATMAGKRAAVLAGVVQDRDEVTRQTRRHQENCQANQRIHEHPLHPVGKKTQLLISWQGLTHGTLRTVWSTPTQSSLFQFSEELFLPVCHTKTLVCSVTHWSTHSSRPYIYVCVCVCVCVCVPPPPPPPPHPARAGSLSPGLTQGCFPDNCCDSNSAASRTLGQHIRRAAVVGWAQHLCKEKRGCSWYPIAPWFAAMRENIAGNPKEAGAD